MQKIQKVKGKLSKIFSKHRVKGKSMSTLMIEPEPLYEAFMRRNVLI